MNKFFVAVGLVSEGHKFISVVPLPQTGFPGLTLANANDVRCLTEILAVKALNQLDATIAQHKKNNSKPKVKE
jgi:hypothetical protein